MDILALKNWLGALVRSRVQNIVDLDDPASFFFGLKKRHGQRKVIDCLWSGQELTEPGQLQKQSIEFFSSLHSSEYVDREELFKEFCGGLPQVSEATNDWLHRPLRESELNIVLQKMQRRRAPGINGLKVEFY